MGIADITSSRAKLIRASEHLHMLDEEIHTFGQHERAKTSRITYGRDGSWYVVYLDPLPPLPLHTALVAGDCLNNLRASLDHLVWQLVLREDKEPGQHHSFPICESIEQFREKCITPAQRFQKRYPLAGIPLNGVAWAVIQRAQPFNYPHPKEDGLVWLNRLTNIDKHHFVFIQRAFVAPNIFASRIRWRPDLQPIERRISTIPLSTKQPTEIARFRFADGATPNLDTDMYVDGDLSLDACIGDQKAQVSISVVGSILKRVRKILDDVSGLPRVQEVALQSTLIE